MSKFIIYPFTLLQNDIKFGKFFQNLKLQKIVLSFLQVFSYSEQASRQASILLKKWTYLTITQLAYLSYGIVHIVCERVQTSSAIFLDF